MISKLISLMQMWQNLKENAIPDSSYYYYCFGIEQGIKKAITEIEKGEQK